MNKFHEEIYLVPGKCCSFINIIGKDLNYIADVKMTLVMSEIAIRFELQNIRILRLRPDVAIKFNK